MPGHRGREPDRAGENQLTIQEVATASTLASECLDKGVHRKPREAYLRFREWATAPGLSEKRNPRNHQSEATAEIYREALARYFGYLRRAQLLRPEEFTEE